MTTDLSIFAARLREFIGICLDDLAHGVQPADRAGREHADAEFNGLALVLFALQFTHNAPYRKLCEARGVLPRTATHWTQIPPVPAAAFKELELTCLPPNNRTAVFHSSGTTEQRPSRHFHNAESLAVYEASLWPWFERHVVPECGVRSAECGVEQPIGAATEHSAFRIPHSAMLAPPPALAPNSSLVHMFETVRRKLGGASGPTSRSEFLGFLTADGSWTLDFKATLAALETNSTRHPPPATLVLGTAFSFVQLLDFLAEKNLRFALPPGSRVMETGGYKGRSRSLPKAELHSLITGRLGIPPSHIISEYGMSELSSQAYDSNASRIFHFPPWARAQIVSPETGREVAEGETGLIRVFDLANVFSVMAVQTEDLGIRRGDGFELLGRAALAEPRGCSLMNVEP